jgi:hypothetical protein
MSAGRAFAMFLTASLIGAPGASWAVPTIAVEDAVEICQSGLQPQPGQSTQTIAQKRGMCVALIDGVVGTVAQIAALAASNAGADKEKVKAVFCLPAEVDYPTLAQTFIDFAKVNEQYNRRAAAAMVIAAYAARYPCP